VEREDARGPSPDRPHYIPNSDELFPGTIINGGIAVTYRDEDHDGEPIGIFTHYPEFNTILQKVVESDIVSMEPEITSSRSFRYTEKLVRCDTQRSARFDRWETKHLDQHQRVRAVLFRLFSERPDGPESWSRCLGLDGRGSGYSLDPSEYLTGPESLDKYKVVAPISPTVGKLGEVPCRRPLRRGPQVAVTQTFITIGCFRHQAAAEACLKYVKSKFARAMLGVLKITQHNPAKVWKYVPVQDFTSTSDIDWSKPSPGDRPAVVLQVRPRCRRDRLYRGQGQADGMTAGEACQRCAYPTLLAPPSVHKTSKRGDEPKTAADTNVLL
jgi:hypothetical protein